LKDEEMFCEHYEQQYVLDELTSRSHALRRGIRLPGWQRMVGGGDVAVGVGRASSLSSFISVCLLACWARLGILTCYNQ